MGLELGTLHAIIIKQKSLPNSLIRKEVVNMPLFPDAVILDVDLSRKSIEKRIISGEVYRLYPGGSALGCYLILQEGMDARIDPFAPEALMAFSVSPTVGLPFAGNSRRKAADFRGRSGSAPPGRSGLPLWGYAAKRRASHGPFDGNFPPGTGKPDRYECPPGQ